MRDDIQELLDTLPDDQPRSRLEQHRELILRLRRQGRTYRRIRQILADKRGVTVALSTLHEFVELRARPTAARISAGEMPPIPVPVVSEPLVVPERGDLSEQIERIRALRNKPVAPVKPRAFVYDPDAKPLTLEKTDKQGA
jgi:hypothetical protein